MWADEAASPGRPSRRVRVLLLGGAATVVAALLATVVLVQAGDGAPADSGDRSGPVRPGPSAGTAAGAGSVTGSPSPAGADGRTEATGSADAGARQVRGRLAVLPPTTVRYAFDAGPGRVMLDTGGHYALRPMVAGGGAVTFPRRGTGYSVRFPARCRLAPARCPRAILESTRTDLFNAGTRPIRYGAAVLMSPTDTGPGANVLQKGFSVGRGTQFKLQVDGAAGRPSCVLSNGAVIYRLVSPVGVADGRWHSVSCARVGGRLAIDVDGVAVSRRVPPSLSIHNSEPLRIGGKGTGPANDQFAGQIDEVFVSLY